MRAAERRQEILRQLKDRDKPLSAAALAEMLGVSRQIVVGDVAMLRATGSNIKSTNRGYLLPSGRALTARYTCKACLTGEDVRRELYAVVDQGGVVEGVSIHAELYGALSAPLRIANRFDADFFVMRAGAGREGRLSQWEHMLTVRCAGREDMQRIAQALAACGALLDWEVPA